MLVVGGSSALGTGPADLAAHALAAAAGATLAWAGCLLPWLWDPTGPERRSLDAADAAVTAAERGGTGAPLPGAVAHAVRVADVAVRTGSRRGDGSLRDRLDGVEQRFLRALPVVGPDVALPPAPAPPGPAGGTPPRSRPRCGPAPGPRRPASPPRRWACRAPTGRRAPR